MSRKLKGTKKTGRQADISTIIANTIITNVKGGVDTRDFFKNYSKLAPLIKKIKKMKGTQKEQAEKLIQEIIERMIKTQKMLSSTLNKGM